MTSTDPVVSPVATGSGWPASVRVCCTRREAQGPGYPGLNVGLHVGDDQARILHNRRRLVAAGVPPVVWLDQVHGREVARVVEVPESPPTADAAWTAVPDLALAIMVADCLPVVLTDAQGNAVAGVHCGWRGLVAGVLEATLDAFQSEDLRACFGPCIGPCHYEVGAEVAERFRETPASCARVPGRCTWISTRRQPRGSDAGEFDAARAPPARTARQGFIHIDATASRGVRH